MHCIFPQFRDEKCKAFYFKMHRSICQRNVFRSIKVCITIGSRLLNVILYRFKDLTVLILILMWHAKVSFELDTSYNNSNINVYNYPLKS